MIKTIVIKETKSKAKPKSNDKLENCISIKNKYLRYFYGCWVKAIHKLTKEYYSGGFLMKIVDNIIFLRNIQSPELVSFDTNNFTFYVKQDSEQYVSMQNAELEKEKIERCVYKMKADQKKLEIDQKKLEAVTIRFNIMKNKFLKLFEDGHVKIVN